MANILLNRPNYGSRGLFYNLLEYSKLHNIALTIEDCTFKMDWSRSTNKMLLKVFIVKPNELYADVLNGYINQLVAF